MANPTLITTPFAQSGDKTTPPNTNVPSDGRFSQTLGFPPVTAIPLGSGGKAPKREDFNGAFNMLANILFYTQKGWIFEWNSGQDYYAGCVVRDTTDGILYECISDVAAGGSVPSADTTHWAAFSVGGGGVSVGFITPFAGTGTPDGWLECDGSAVSRSLYADLFSAIGTTWGAGNGTTTFNIPNLKDKVAQGASTTNPVGTSKNAGLPNISGSLHSTTASVSPTGAFTQTTSSSGYGLNYATNMTGIINFTASNSSSIYGNSSTVQPPASCVRFMIKY